MNVNVSPPNRTPLRALVTCIVVYWLLRIGTAWYDIKAFYGFLFFLIAGPILAIFYLTFWLRGRALSRGRRWGIVLAFALAAAAAALLAHHTVGILFSVMSGIPVALTALTLWLLLAHGAQASTKTTGAIVAIILAWAWWPTVRMEGLAGNQLPEFHWRWSASPEEQYIASLAAYQHGATTRPATATIARAPGDWPGFRGPLRDGIARGETIRTDWSAHPPKLLWRRPIGPAWSSMCVIGDALYTQEQRGELETVVAVDARTGNEIWAHTDKVRYEDGQSGAGPRATPTFADGKIYTLGGTGILNCLDAASGQVVWSRSAAGDASATPPIWGFCSSPLVSDGVVIVFLGGNAGKGLLAYRADTGEPAWAIDAGATSWSSPQLATIDGIPLVLMLSDRGLFAVKAATGDKLWDYEMPSQSPRNLQPHPTDRGVLISTGMDEETQLLTLARNDRAWRVTPAWSSRGLKSTFNDFVTLDGAIYGFDAGIFCCIDELTGKRLWKKGRYGRGQVILLPEQKMLVVISEEGNVVALAANAKEQQELGEFQAVSGKVWNHPAISRGRLYVRSDQEMAGFDVSVMTPR